MAKHLAPKKKHELNFINRILPAPSGQKPSAHVLEAPPKEKAPKEKAPEEKLPKEKAPKEKVSERVRRLAPKLGRFPWVFCALAALLLVILRFLPLEGWMVPAAYAIPLLLAMAEQAVRAGEKFRAGELLNRELICCVAAVLLFVTQSYTESVLLLLLFYAVSFTEKLFFERSMEQRERISQIQPDHAMRITEEGIERVDCAAVEPGDILLVAAGERIPLDGVIVDGITTIDTAAVSGQRSPWAVNVGYRVYSGCRNLTSDIRIRASRALQQSTAEKIVRVAKSAADFPSEQELISRRVQRIYVPVILGLAFLIGILVPVFRGGWASHIRRAVVLMITACTAVDQYAVSLLYRKALSASEALGVFSKGTDCLESIARAETVIFDKTGTITEGRYAVTDVYPVKMTEKQLLTIAAAGESFSRHPIAAAIREAAGKMDERVARATRLHEIPGRGISAIVGGRQLLVGNAALLDEYGVRYNIPSRPGVAVHVAVDTRYCGYIMVTDKVRRRAFDALETLRVNGVKKLVLLTGDVISVARPIASRLNFDMLRAELRPEEKVKAVNYLMKNKGQRSTILFVGDGENSGKIMSHADTGIAMGSLGSDVALACADVMIMDRDIFKIPKLLVIARLAYRAALENFAAGVGVSALLALLGLFGVLKPLAAEILCFLLSMALLANTLRIK